MCLPKFTADRSLDRTAEPYGLTDRPYGGGDADGEGFRVPRPEQHQGHGEVLRAGGL